MNPTIKKAIKHFYKFLFNVGIDLRSIFSLRHYPKYLTQQKEFQKLGGKITLKYAIFTDYDDQAGPAVIVP